MKNKFLFVVLLCLLMVLFVACGKNYSSGKTSSSSTKTDGSDTTAEAPKSKTFEKMFVKDKFGDDTEDFYITNKKELSGTFIPTEGDSKNIKWTLKMLQDGTTYITINEPGITNSLSTDGASLTVDGVTIDPEKVLGEYAAYFEALTLYLVDFKANGEIVDQDVGFSMIFGDSPYLEGVRIEFPELKNKNQLAMNYDKKDVFTENSSLRIAISNDAGTYLLDEFDTVDFAEAFYDRTEYDRGLALLEEGKIQEALDVFEQIKNNNEDVFDFYHINSDVSECHAKLGYYKVGDIGPAGGFIFYDKGDDSDGWRYLEITADSIAYVPFGYYRKDGIDSVAGTDSSIGSGLENTEKLVEAMNQDGKAYRYNASSWYSDQKVEFPAKLCLDYEQNGYSDWFLPSKEELAKAREYDKYLVSSAWSSTEDDGENAWMIRTWSGYNDGSEERSWSSSVLAVRRFSL